MSIDAKMVPPLDRTKKIKWVIVFLMCAAIFLVPTNEIYTSNIRNFLVLTVFNIMLLVFDLLPILFIGAMLPLSYVAFGVSPAATALTGWSNDVAYSCLGGYLFAGALSESGAMQRIALWCMAKMRGSYIKMLFTFTAIGTVLTIVSFGNDGNIVTTMAFGFCVALGIEHQKEGAVFMMASGVAIITARLLCYYPIQMIPMTAAAQVVDPNFSFSATDPFIYGLPILLFIFFYIFVLTKVTGCKNSNVNTGGAEEFVTRYQELGKMKRDEKIVLIWLAGMSLWMLLKDVHGLNMNLAYMVGPWLLFLPGINVITPKMVKFLTDRLGMLLFIVGCLGIASTASYCGATALLAEVLVPVLSGFSKLSLLFMIMSLGMVGNMLLTPLALITTFATPVVEIADALGVGLKPVLLTLYYTVDMLFFPHEVPAYLFTYSFGVISLKQFISFHALKNLLFIVFFAVLIYPWWGILGLL